MKLKVLFLSLLLVGSLLTVRCQDDEDDEDIYDEDEADDMDVDLEDEAEDQEQVEQVEYSPPEPVGPVHLAEPFDSASVLGSKWMPSQAKKDGVDEDIAKYNGKWAVEEPETTPLAGDMGLVLKSKAKHHAIAAKLDKPFEFVADPLVVQYEVKFQNSHDCGGAYVKLLTNNPDLKLDGVHDKTPYTIMFGPDKCGADSKLHFIFRHKNPKSGEFEEKHAKKPTGSFSHVFTDQKVHLFTLVVNPDNTFQVYVDQKVVSEGSLLEDMSPAVNPPAEIEDPDDKKPKDWDDRKKIPEPGAEKPDDWDEDAPAQIEDENAVKPDGWLDDEPELIDDPDAERPDDWDDDMDGEWEPPKINNPLCDDVGCGEWKPPMVPNPGYKGKWKPPYIDNPNYQGEWKPRMIANPDFFEDLEPFKMSSIGAIALELWSMSDNILFDNFIITTDKDVADQYAADSYHLKRKEGVVASAETFVSSMVDAAQERPWLWAVFALIVIIPLFFCIRFCFKSSPEELDSKKSDAPSPDDVREGEEGEEEEEEAAAAEGGEKEGEEAVSAEGDASVRQRKKATKADLEGPAEEEEEEEEAAAEEPQEKASTPKKPKTRSRKE
ncbi:calnexin-like [Diadema antillarum]|uniref:calnexin-like n=1 Tax=Diadema antillarum TaxID=105358 RepID=UPI003A85AF64